MARNSNQESGQYRVVFSSTTLELFDLINRYDYFDNKLLLHKKQQLQSYLIYVYIFFSLNLRFKKMK